MEFKGEIFLLRFIGCFLSVDRLGSCWRFNGLWFSHSSFSPELRADASFSCLVSLATHWFFLSLGRCSGPFVRRRVCSPWLGWNTISLMRFESWGWDGRFAIKTMGGSLRSTWNSWFADWNGSNQASRRHLWYRLEKNSEEVQCNTLSLCWYTKKRKLQAPACIAPHTRFVPDFQSVRKKRARSFWREMD